MRRTAIALLVPVALAACGDDTPNSTGEATSAVSDLNDELDRLREQFGTETVDTFKIAAEHYITESDGDIADALSMTFTDAVCEMPADLNLGTSYTCTATGDDGETYTFTAEIDSGAAFQITGVEPAPSED